MNFHPDVVEPNVGNKDKHGVFGTFLDLSQFDVFLLRCFRGTSEEVHVAKEGSAKKRPMIESAGQKLQWYNGTQKSKILKN